LGDAPRREKILQHPPTCLQQGNQENSIQTMKSVFFTLLFTGLFTVSALRAAEIREFMDLQSHATMNVPYKFFKNGLRWIKKGKAPKVSYKHRFRNVIYADYLAGNSGARIVINGAMAAEVAFI